jgi:NADH dehydrogenase FAD-containing subunit
MVTLANLARLRESGCDVTVVQPSPHHYYSGMGPGMLSRMYSPGEIRFATRRVVEKQGGRFLLDKAVAIDPDFRTVRLQSGGSLGYDLLSCNVGSSVPAEALRQGASDVFPVKPIAGLLRARERVRELASRRSIHAAVAGGGPGALEVAANLRRLLRDVGRHSAEITLFAGRKLLAKYPRALREKGRRTLQRLGIALREEGYVREADTNRLVLENGAVHEPDVILLALGVRPPSLFAESGIPTGPDGGLLVNEYLQSVRYPEIFGGGDCIHFQPRPLARVGVYAVRENPVLLANLRAAVEGKGLERFDPGGGYMLIFNTGDGRGILMRSGLVLSGKWVFRLKDRIDRGFMRRFQALE